MRSAVVPVLLVLGVLVGGCGAEPAPVGSTSGTTADPPPTESPMEGVGNPTAEQLAHEEWLSGGPLATSTPTRTCVQHTPTGEEWAAWEAAETDEDRIAADPNWTSCFDVTGYATTPPPEPTCDVPPDLPEGESFGCVVVEPPRLTQRMVDDWNAFVDQEELAGARRLGMTLEEYRAAYVDERG